jgi:hypothetical protein
VCRLAVSAWIFGIDSLFVSNTVTAYDVVGGGGDALVEGELNILVKAQARVQKSASMPHALMLVTVVVLFVAYRILRATFKQCLSHMLFLICPRDCCGHDPEKYLQTKKKRVSVSGNALSSSGEYGKAAIDQARRRANAAGKKQGALASNLTAAALARPDPIVGRLPPFTETFAKSVPLTLIRQTARDKEKARVAAEAAEKQAASGGSTTAFDAATANRDRPITHKLVSAQMQMRGWGHTCCRSDFLRPCVDPFCVEVHQRRRQWMSEGDVQGVKHSKGSFCRTWEVIRLNQNYSYRMELNEEYQHVLHLRQEVDAERKDSGV